MIPRRSASRTSRPGRPSPVSFRSDRSDGENSIRSTPRSRRGSRSPCSRNRSNLTFPPPSSCIPGHPRPRRGAKTSRSRRRRDARSCPGGSAPFPGECGSTSPRTPCGTSTGRRRRGRDAGWSRSGRGKPHPRSTFAWKRAARRRCSKSGYPKRAAPCSISIGARVPFRLRIGDRLCAEAHDPDRRSKALETLAKARFDPALPGAAG